ncbi:hypothetical protein AVEN_44473-1 [Araneus ventricosus]|uniref:Uncharacterized protein n=1 Tax=Araneus ventricosus TaxID=182803 RepID=A0A4Y2P5B9_ARAVE|nr:hypothetical protein AVEN_44473-1 [Araneus ventricosus]
MTDRTHELPTPAIKPLHSLPEVPIVPKNESNGCHQTSHLDNETTKRNSDKYVSNLAGNSVKEHKNFNNPKEVQQSKVAKDSKNKINLPSVKGTKKGSTTRDNTKAPKRKQKAPEIVDQKKRKTEKATSKNENTTLKEDDGVIHEETPTISGEQDNIDRDEENPIIIDLTDDDNQENEEIIQTPSETVENQNIQTNENANETREASSNSVKGTEGIISKELKDIGEKLPQKRSASKPATKPKAKAPKTSKPLPANKRQKDNLKTKQLGQKRKK